MTISTRCYRLGSRLRFLLKAGDEHGVHSPFMFELVDNHLNKASELPLHPALTQTASQWPLHRRLAINAVITHLDPAIPLLCLSKENLETITEINRVFYLSPALLSELKTDELYFLKKNLGLNSSLVFGSPYENPSSAKNWKKFCDSLPKGVILDTWHAAVFFKRERQADEYFAVRF
ncbi:hypothetical protein [Robertkochia aurantiaca]|uniref:hypothetical protein n=1 Tax=Robertkochia aurantiaca TaxID=2873700 RepID=UPI001CCCD17A|nr:hypothetical protein [Robertkochia sp. 3YJGBD-33]